MSQSLHVFYSHCRLSNGKRTMSWENLSFGIWISTGALVKSREWIVLDAHAHLCILHATQSQQALSHVASDALHNVMRPRTKCLRLWLVKVMHALQRVGGGTGGPDPLEKLQRILGFLSNTDTDPLKITATKLGTDDGPLIVVFGSSLPSSIMQTHEKETAGLLCFMC